jgi:hypothetical protein
MCPTPIGVRVQDEPMRLEVQMTSETGELLGTADAEYTPRCPDGDQLAFCERICEG